ncbi:MAG: adenylate cyclase [Maribacter sp.]|jgi:adenylate cyclase
MKHIIGFWFVFLLLVSTVAAQDIATLEAQLKKEKSPAKLADINNLLAQAYLSKNGDKTISYAKAAIKYAEASKNNIVKAEALNFQAKATAGYYAPNKTAGRKAKRGTRDYYDGLNLFLKSMKLAKSIGYTQLELDNIANLAYLNTKRIGSHSPDDREEIKYYKMYIDRLNEIKKVTKPTATYTTNPSSNGNNNSNNGGSTTKPQSSGADKFVKQLVAEKRELKDQVDDLEEERKELKKELNVLNETLKRALDSGTSAEEIEKIKEEQQKIEKQLKAQNKSDKNKFNKEKEKLEEAMTEAELKAKAANAEAAKFQIGVILGGIIAALILSFLYFGYRSQSKARKKLADKNEEIVKEQQRSEELLLNILPKDIAEELKTKGAAKARRHNNVTVLFSDFKNFTRVAETLSPEGLVKELDYCFKGFDYIISQYPSIEKIKTIGDAYMCCSGLTGKHSSSTSDMVKAAMDMQEFLFDYKADRQVKNLPFFEARIGLHTGPVVSGVVGNKKFAYDIWGDTVNVASRMESNGDVGKVNVSADTYKEIRYKFSCHPRGKIQVKNKGLIEMYFVDKAYT